MDRFAYAAHDDLLSQVASSEAERHAVRRILGDELQRDLRRLPRLTEADLDARNADKAWPSCCGACSQGRRICPTPQACQVSDEADPPRPEARAGDALRVIVGVLFGWAVVVAALLAMGVRL